MCYERALKALNLEPTDMIPLMGTLGNSKFGEKITGVKSTDEKKFMKAFYGALDVDMTYVMAEKINPKPVTQTAGTVYGSFEDFEESFPFYDSFSLAYKGYKLARTKTASQLWVVERSFKTYKELLTYLEGYDPREDETRSFEKIVEQCQTSYRHYQDILGDTTLVAGETYLSLFTFFIVRIGWTLLARLIINDPDVFDELMRKYSEVSKRHMEAWATTGIKALVCHDDIATENGPVMAQRLFREHIFPVYREVWRPLKDKGIKLIFISDGNYVPLMDGLAEAGADGFKLNPDALLSHDDFESLCVKHGGKKVLMISPNQDVMVHGSAENIVHEAEFITQLAKKYNGIFVHDLCGSSNFEECYKIWVSNRKIR